MSKGLYKCMISPLATRLVEAGVKVGVKAGVKAGVKVEDKHGGSVTSSVVVMGIFAGWKKTMRLARGGDGKLGSKIEHAMGFVVDGRGTTSPNYAVVGDGHGSRSSRL